MNRKYFRILNLIGMCLVMALLPVITGCGTTSQKRSVQTSGFLNDYSQLKDGSGDQALKVYIDKSADFGSYTQIIIEPVSIVVTEDSEMAKVSAADRQKMADYFFAALNKELGAKYPIVSTPGPNTLKLRVALTEIKDSNVTMDTISTILPIGLAIDLIKYAATGTHLYVGDANAEIEVLDSATGKRLAAAVDGRSGDKVTGEFDKWGDWTDTQDACDFWAQRIAQRLEELSAGK